MKRTATTYLVLERDQRGRKTAARIVKHSVTHPDLKAGQCAVRIAIEVPEEAFETLLVGQKLTFSIDETVKATISKLDADVS